MIEGLALTALPLMWSFWGVATVFVAIRLYTKAYIIKSIGWDDYTYCASSILLLLYTSCIHMASIHGYGQDFDTLTVDDQVLALKWVYIGKTFCLAAMATAKVSLGLFLLLLVVIKWYRRVIMVVVSALCLSAAMVIIVLWLQCLPLGSIYDSRVTSTRIIPRIGPYAMVLGVTCVAADFFFATFPLLFIWKLKMKQKEKIIISCSMSSGILAGICGIIRNVQCRQSIQTNVTSSTVGIAVWSAAEIAVTMICIGIPILRKFIKRAVLGRPESLLVITAKKDHRVSDSTLYTLGPARRDESRRNSLKPKLRDASTEIQVVTGTETRSRENALDNNLGDGFLKAPNSSSKIQVQDEREIEYRMTRRRGSIVS